ncbi:MAG: HAD-IA family hydrolase [Actinobacteria bacterium]|uniref:Unannotated protein n=1 Tax=freshwater metagenome TaxID=449393 RepID=A0A6J6H533_9ZZZZ|nr:HAD-IA family hydrolase [Actinomycetota bacterium]
MPASPFAAILFDMDGTLIDSEPIWLGQERLLMSEFGHEWTDANQQYCLGGPLSKVGRYMSQLVLGAQEPEFFEEQLVSRVTEELKLGVSTVPGALELAREIFAAQIPTALVSASPRSLMNAALNGFYAIAPDLVGLFDISISMDDVVRTKPDPEGYLSAAETLGVPISECLVIEDSLTGITSGLASGAYVLAVPHLFDVAVQERMVILPSLQGQSLGSIESLYR